MNKFLLLMLAIVSLFATSCSSDDEPEINYAKDVASVYSGYTNASSTYFSDMISENQSVKVEIVSNTTVNVTFDSDTWGHTVISNAEVSFIRGIYHFRQRRSRNIRTWWHKKI